MLNLSPLNSFLDEYDRSNAVCSGHRSIPEMLEQVLQQQESIRQMLQKQMETISSLPCGSEKSSSAERIVLEDVIEAPLANIDMATGRV